LTNEDRYIIDYIEGRPITCAKCGKEMDWRETAKKTVEENFMFYQALASSAEVLCAALFGLQYVRHLRKQLLTA
jgi:hypothetical protein